ncbi:MAG: Ig-like domain-containing protein [Verrucomicrobia bacterium]|nr:Ig-like domain-containing protein [Verrucomicrobiota bacterium]
MRTIRLLSLALLTVCFLYPSPTYAGEGDPPGEIGDAIYHDSGYTPGWLDFLYGLFFNFGHFAADKPGHAGVYVGLYYDFSNQGIIHCEPHWHSTSGYTLLKGGGDATSYYDTRAIYAEKLTFFTDKTGDSAFRGSRTTTPAPTPAQRQEIVAYAEEKLDLPISYWSVCENYWGSASLEYQEPAEPPDDFHAKGGHRDIDEIDSGLFLTDDFNAFSCVGFVERCYEVAGLDPTPDDDEIDHVPFTDYSAFVVPNQFYSSGMMWSETLPPRIVSRAYSTARNTDIAVTFAADNLDSASFAGNVSVVGSSSGSHGASLSYSPANYRLTLNPSSDFSYGENVTVTLTTGIRDLADNTLDGDGDGDEGPNHTFSFTIQDQPGAPPTSISVNANASDTSIEPYDTITISGTATYNNGDPVDGTATIDTGSGTYTTPVLNGNIVSRSVVGPGSSRNVSVYVTDDSLSDTDYIYVSVSGDGGTGSYDLETHVVWKVEDEGDGYCSYWYKDAFRTADDHVDLLALIDNADLSSDLDFALKFYYPSGSQYGSTLSEDNAFPASDEWGYWYWGFLISGQSMAQNPGKYRIKFYVDDDRKATEYYVVAWDFVNHWTCNTNDDENPIPSGGKTTFLTTDPQVMALHHFEKRCQGMDVKTEFYAPDGHKEVDGEYSFPDDRGPHEWWNDSWHWQTMSLAGTSREYMCGDWTVKFYVKNPVTSSWQLQYTDYFRIQESVDPSITISASPATPIETQAVTLNMSASDNNHLKKVTVHWHDGSWHENSWDSINASSWNKAHSIGSGVAPGQTLEYWGETWDESGNRAESGHHFVTVQSETVTVPQIPSGPSIVYIDDPVAFTVSGSSSSVGSPVEYQFAWGDGYTSTWGSATVPHTWDAEGECSVTARACSEPRPSNMSGWSIGRTITVRDWNKDYDGDGMTDAQEAVAGTDPSIGDSKFYVCDADAGLVAGDFILCWPSVSNRYYHIGMAYDLVTGFTGYMVSNIDATPPMNCYTTHVEEPPAFFQLGVTTNQLGD